MEWNQLHNFLTAAREENLSRAAEHLEVSQPSLSQTIKRLEEELGYSLFDRTGKRLRLNESGKIMMQTIEQMEEMMQNTRLRLEELNNLRHPEVSIHAASASALLPEMLVYLKKCNPRIQYRIYQWQPECGEHGADIQIIAGPVGNPGSAERKKEGSWGVGNGELDEVLLVEDICLILPPGHPLLKKKQLMLKDLRQEEFISLNEQWEIGREIKREMNARSFTPKTTMLVDNPNMMRELLKAQMGIAFVPSTYGYSFAGEELAVRWVADFRVSRAVCLHTKPRKYLTREQKDCIKGIKRFFSELPDKTKF